MSIFGETVTLRNLTPRKLGIVLEVHYDGKAQKIFPGDNPGFPKVAAPFAKRQNPIKGTEDPENPTMSGTRYLVAVVDGGDPGDDAPELTLAEWYAHLGKPQRLNRDLLDKEPKTHEIIKARPGYNAREARANVGVQEADA